MKTVIMAGGKGSRISGLFPDIPKPMILLESASGEKKPVLEWEIEGLKRQGLTDIILTVGYKADQIQDYFGDGSQFGVHIKYYVEKEPLGNAGALFRLSEILNSVFLLLNADAVFDVNFRRMMNFHKEKKARVTLLTHPNSHPYDSGLIVTDENGVVKKWLAKEDVRPKYYKNRVNAGIHIIDPAILSFSGIDPDSIGSDRRIDLDRMLLKPLCEKGVMYAYDSPEYVKDMGTPERYHQVYKDFHNGVVQTKNLSRKQKAIFLDRDGTINRYVGFMRNIEDFELLPKVTDAIKLINESGYLCIVVTNQPVIARGEVSFEELRCIHDKMETLLGNEGAYIDGLYFCPHHPDKGFEGEVPELKINCDCRKPKPGMLLQAAVDYNIDLTNSWMIGDGENDVLAGKNAGCHTALISDTENYGQDISASCLLEAIERILNC